MLRADSIAALVWPLSKSSELGVQRRLQAWLSWSSGTPRRVRLGRARRRRRRPAAGAAARACGTLSSSAAQRRPVRVEQRAGLVGLDQRVGERFGARRRPRQRQAAAQARSTEAAISILACASSIPRRCPRRWPVARAPAGTIGRIGLRTQTLSSPRSPAAPGPWHRRYAARRSRPSVREAEPGLAAGAVDEDRGDPPAGLQLGGERRRAAPRPRPRRGSRRTARARPRPRRAARPAPRRCRPRAPASSASASAAMAGSASSATTASAIRASTAVE